MRLPEVDAIAFDAVGTLIHPEPSAAEAYGEVGRRHGSRRTATEIAVRFAAAFAREEERDRAAGLRTSEEREVERWRNIVGSVLDDVADLETCFQELFEHFRRPQSWRCDPDAAAVLAELSRRGFALGLASNFDRRLRPIAAGLAELQLLTGPLVISSEVGWRKPAAGFFEALCERFARPAARVLLVGDDFRNDFEGARAVGMQALLLDPGGREPMPASARLRRLAELVAPAT